MTEHPLDIPCSVCGGDFRMADKQEYEMAYDEAQDAYRTYERVQASADAAFAHYLKTRDRLKATKAKVLDVLV